MQKQIFIPTGRVILFLNKHAWILATTRQCARRERTSSKRKGLNIRILSSLQDHAKVFDIFRPIVSICMDDGINLYFLIYLHRLTSRTRKPLPWRMLLLVVSNGNNIENKNHLRPDKYQRLVIINIKGLS